MKAFVLIAALFITLAMAQTSAKAQVKRKVAQTPGPVAAMPPPPPPPPGPPPEFIDDDTEFDDGDDLPDDYVPPPMPGRQAMPGQQPPPLPGNGQVPFPPPAGQQFQQPPKQAVTPPPPPPIPTYANDRPRLQSGTLHFRVLRDEFAKKGEKRERGKIDQQ